MTMIPKEAEFLTHYRNIVSITQLLLLHKRYKCREIPSIETSLTFILFLFFRNRVILAR